MLKLPTIYYNCHSLSERAENINIYGRPHPYGYGQVVCSKVLGSFL